MVSGNIKALVAQWLRHRTSVRKDPGSKLHSAINRQKRMINLLRRYGAVAVFLAHTWIQFTRMAELWSLVLTRSRYWDLLARCPLGITTRPVVFLCCVGVGLDVLQTGTGCVKCCLLPKLLGRCPFVHVSIRVQDGKHLESSKGSSSLSVLTRPIKVTSELINYGHIWNRTWPQH